jgi:ABC-2 type transport system ATP-binding protein
MASGRTINAVLPGIGTDALSLLPGVLDATRRAERVQLTCADSDAALRALLNTYPAVHDIEISAAGLEEAFLALTAKENV